MKNWSENQTWSPRLFYQPTTADEIRQIVVRALEAKQKIRVYGTAHSFTALNNTDAIALNLDNYQGLISIDEQTNQVTVKAGTKLHILAVLLASHNLAFENMGDIDKQSIAGAISTGTHGTGTAFGNLSTQIVAIKFINGLGKEVYCSATQNYELFKCMQVSLGALGIITELTLQCVPNYKLKLIKKVEHLESVLKNLNTYNQNTRNFEFYWFPYTNKVQTKYSNITTEQADTTNFINYLNDVVVENYAFKIFCSIAKIIPRLNISISKLSAQFISGSVKIKECKDVYATPRLVKFNEMEYNIPMDAYQDCIKDVTRLVNSKKFNIHFPIENRFVKQDDIYMSPAYERDSAYIACHVYKGKDFKAYFKALEDIFKKYNGRPHWGKLHFKNKAYFNEVYPMFDVFLNNRKTQDPDNVFLNSYLQDLVL